MTDDEDVVRVIEIGMDEGVVVGDQFLLPEEGFNGTPCDACLVGLDPIHQQVASREVIQIFFVSDSLFGTFNNDECGVDAELFKLLLQCLQMFSSAFVLSAEEGRGRIAQGRVAGIRVPIELFGKQESVLAGIVGVESGQLKADASHPFCQGSKICMRQREAKAVVEIIQFGHFPGQHPRDGPKCSEVGDSIGHEGVRGAYGLQRVPTVIPCEPRSNTWADGYAPDNEKLENLVEKIGRLTGEVGQEAWTQVGIGTIEDITGCPAERLWPKETTWLAIR